MTGRWAPIALAASLGLPACSSYKSAPDAPPLDCAGDAGNYPPCPYGVSVGDVVADATFPGYRTFQSPAVESLSLHDLYDPDHTKGKKLLFVNAGAVWCGPCREEAQELPAVWSALHDQVEFVTVVFEGAVPGTPSTTDDVENWVTSFETPFWGVADPQGAILAYFNKTTPPFTMLVDPSTMKIVDTVVGKPADVIAWVQKHL